jgi:Phage integrase, N-terminal SAM-like domain
VAPSRSVMAGILPDAVRRNKSETARSGSGRQTPKHYNIRTEQAYTDWTRHFIVFHTKRNNGVWRDPREGTDADVSEFLTYFKASLRQFHIRGVCSRA